MKKEEKKKNKYCVRFWYTWHTDVEIEAEDASEAEEIAYELPEDMIFEGHNTGDLDLEYDTIEIFGGEE